MLFIILPQASSSAQGCKYHLLEAGFAFQFPPGWLSKAFPVGASAHPLQCILYVDLQEDTISKKQPVLKAQVI